MVENFQMKFHMDADLPSVLVMQSSTHFREVLNEMLHGNDTSDNDTAGKTVQVRVGSARLPPIHLTDEESEIKERENENSTKNIGKFPSNPQS